MKSIMAWNISVEGASALRVALPMEHMALESMS